MISAIKTIRTDNVIPYENLALEHVLTRHVREGECILFLWQNRDTVVIGKNQNAWEECRVDWLDAHGGYLARRLSGGGAVYHDLGNLNFSLITRSEDYDTARQSEVILRAVRRLGVPAERTGRNDIEAEGRKFSGHAFYEHRGCWCHHGTLMMDVNLERMQEALSVPQAKLRSRGVSSVRSRVVNLKTWCPSLDRDRNGSVPRRSKRPRSCWVPKNGFSGGGSRLPLSWKSASAGAASGWKCRLSAGGLPSVRAGRMPWMNR